MPSRSVPAFLALVLAVGAPSQVGPGSSGSGVPGRIDFDAGQARIRRSVDPAAPGASWSRDGGQTWHPLQVPDDSLHFRLLQFDPLLDAPRFVPPLDVPAGNRLLVVQFHTQILAEYRAAVMQAGAEILHYLPANALFVRGDPAMAGRLRQLPCVRWVGDLPNAFKLDGALRAFVSSNAVQPVDCNLVLATKADRARLIAAIAQTGGQLIDPCPGSVMVRARLSPAQLVAVLSLDSVTWADVAGPDGVDVDNARVQGGANYVESLAGYRGQGVRVEVTEGFDELHQDLAGRVLVRGTNYVSMHGHATAGIVGGSGAGNPAARGMLPESDLIEGAYSSTNHYLQIQDSVNPALPWRTMVATASWGAAQTTDYNSISQAMDDALFDSDLTRINSQSNNGNQTSRPEAWAKNIIAVGGVKHLDDAWPGNDRWNMPGDTSAASIGPAADGRLKPDLCAFYDSVLTIDLAGAAGYTPGDYNPDFAGTSAAAPIVAGYVGLMQQMFTDGLFGNPLPLPPTPANRFANKPHMTTSKALACNTAEQYPFVGTGDDLTRTHQGWGFPSLQRLYDNRHKIVVVDEYDTLQLGQAREYWVQVPPGTPEFRATMVYADPEGQANAAIHRVNDVNLQVTRVADGVSWWGNNGLATGTASTSGGLPNDRDTIESVYLPNPVPGSYVVRVEAASIVEDGKVETPQLDVDYALVLHPTEGYRNATGLALDLVSSGPGNLTVNCSNVPASGWNEGYTAISLTTDRAPGFGRFFGLEDDGLTVALWLLPSAPDNPFHFPHNPGGYPFSAYTFDPGLISWLATYQVKIDAMLVLWGGGEIVAVSNVDRIAVQ